MGGGAAFGGNAKVEAPDDGEGEENASKAGILCRTSGSKEFSGSKEEALAIRDDGTGSASAASSKAPEGKLQAWRKNRAEAIREYRRSNASKREEATKALCKSAIRGADSVQNCEDQVMSAFREWDSDGNGQITRDELAVVLEALCADGKCKLPKGSIDVLLKEADVDGDKGISYQEMIDWLFCSPNLEKYFSTSEAIHKFNLQEAKRVAQECEWISHHSNDQFEAQRRIEPVSEKYRQDCQDRIDNQLTPLIQKSFAWHDKDGDGVLDYDESIIFFSNYASLIGPYLIMAAELSAAHHVMNLSSVKDPARVEKIVRVYTKKIKRRMAVYLRNKDECHRAAFQVLDVSDDGHLQESEVVEGLLHGHDRNTELMNAFGLVVPPEEIMVEITSPEDHLAKDCNQQ